MVCQNILAVELVPQHAVEEGCGLLHQAQGKGIAVVDALGQNKLQVFRYYKELYTKLGLYDQVQPQLYKFLTAFSENAYPSGSPQKIIMDMANRWGFGVLDASDKEKKNKTEPDA